MKIKDRVLYAEEGLVLTNGTQWGKIVVLAEGADQTCWQEIPLAEAETLEQVPAELALAELREVLL